jgi:hypothetical protein
VDECKVDFISPYLAREVAEREHYMHRKPQVSFAFGLFREDVLVGICVFGIPASRHLQIGVCPSEPNQVLELNRLWVSDEMPRNSESWFVSRCLAQLPPYIIVSYSDTIQGHMGYVYRALNFHYAGWTDMERKTARLDYTPADPAVHTRDAYRHGWDHIVRRKPKVKYWIVTGNRTDRKRLERLCGWPKMSWKEDPPPTEHRKYIPPKKGNYHDYDCG